MQQSFEGSVHFPLREKESKASDVTSALETSAPRLHLDPIAAGTGTSFDTVGLVNECQLGSLEMGGARL